jgi:hypothetical protein
VEQLEATLCKMQNPSVYPSDELLWVTALIWKSVCVFLSCLAVCLQIPKTQTISNGVYFERVSYMNDAEKWTSKALSFVKM